MNDEELRILVDNTIARMKEQPLDMRRALFSVLKEVERETRHRCTSIVYEAASKVSNLNRIQK